MLAVEKPKQPKIIKYVWWDGFNKEEVFPTVEFSRFTVHDEDPWCVRIVYEGNRVRDIEHGFYLCCEVGHSNKDIFTLSKEKFEKTYNSLLDK